MGTPSTPPPGPPRVPVPAGPAPPAFPGLLGIVIQWVTSIRTWRRAGIAVVLGFAGLVGTLVYQSPERVWELATLALRPTRQAGLPEMTPLASDVGLELRQLAAQFPTMGGTAAFRVNLETNEQKLVGAVAADAYALTLRQLRQDRWDWPSAAFRDNAEVDRALAQLYLGRFVCMPPPKDAWRGLERFPLRELCLVAVPPDGIGLAGFLATGWAQPVPEQDRGRLEIAMRRAAAGMVWGKRGR